MKVVVDIEANSLNSPSKIWCIVCKDADTNEYNIFRNVTENVEPFRQFINSRREATYIGHGLLSYDKPVIWNLLNIDLPIEQCIDTLILSKLVNYSREGGHSVEQYGLEFGLEKIKFSDWTKWSLEMEKYCVRDVDISHRIYNHYTRIHNDHSWHPAIRLEQQFQLVVNELHDNGFGFNLHKCTTLLERVSKELEILDEEILKAFPPREIVIREFTPKATKFGTISKTSVPRSLYGRIHEYEIGKTYKHTKEEAFNPSSHKQIVQVLAEAGWSPTDKTKTHIETERELNRIKHGRGEAKPIDLEKLSAKLVLLKKYGWKINEANLNSLPDTAPSPARTLAKRILLEARRRTLTEWLGLVNPDTNRIHGTFYGIGAWTHRMAHQRPNTANIPNEFELSGKLKLLGKEMRSLWCAPKNRLLVGVDAEGIQLRIFAHYIDDKEFTDALVNGSKADKTDPHSLNQRILGSVCKSRAAAKRFIFALLLGAGIGKLAEILETSVGEAKGALDHLIQRYSGFAHLKETIIPRDAKRGYFTGLDDRKVAIPGDTISERKHLAMSGYLQNGEAVVMKKACLKWQDLLKEENAILVNFVHDEWQTETPNNMEIALKVARTQSVSLRIVGEELGLKCPLAGSFWNEDKKDYTIGTNWSVTH